MICAAMVLVAMGCHASENKTAAPVAASVPSPAPTSQTAIRQRVEQMRQVDYEHQDEILSVRLLQALNHAHSIFNISEDDTYVGFEWNANVLDVCGDKEPQVKIGNVQVVDDTHAKVDMRYVDQPCYDIPYVLYLVWENGNWMIDDVDYPESEEDGWGNLRSQCDSYYNLMVEAYKTDPAQDILENMLSMEPSEEDFQDPGTIYYKNPKEVLKLINQINNGHELFKKNPGYTPAMGQKIEQMLERISNKAARYVFVER